MSTSLPGDANGAHVGCRAAAGGRGRQGAAARRWALSQHDSCSPGGEAALKERAERKHPACEAAQSAPPAQEQEER